MADKEGGPSAPKRARTATKHFYGTPLSDIELEKLLMESDDDFGEADMEVVDSDEDYVAGEVSSDEDDLGDMTGHVDKIDIYSFIIYFSS